MLLIGEQKVKDYDEANDKIALQRGKVPPTSVVP
jgi:hypothetical protein